jgi:hypothetical protein
VPLDHVQSLAAIDALVPDTYAAEVAAALPADVEACDAALAAALAHIDATAARIMRIRLDHALAADTSIAPPTRKVFAQTVVAYVNDLDLLARRALDVAARGGARDPAAAAQLVVDAARATLALREALRGPVLALVRARAAAAAADADRRARDRTLDEPQRRRWSAVRRELEAVAADAARVTTAPFAVRVASWPAQLDEPAPEPEPTLAELIELD